METDTNQAVQTPNTENNGGTKTTETPIVENKTVDNGQNSTENKTVEPYKTFASKEEFDKHSAGILNSAKNKAEKELLAMLGLKPDEKDKLSKFKEAYDATLSESEKQAHNLEELNSEVTNLKSQLTEKDAVISALSKLTGKDANDVDKYVKMARGLVDENTTIDQALDQVLTFMKPKEQVQNPVPQGKPLNEPASVKTPVKNPFETGNITEQGKLISTDRAKAREMYYAVHGKAPNW